MKRGRYRVSIDRTESIPNVVIEYHKEIIEIKLNQFNSVPKALERAGFDRRSIDRIDRAVQYAVSEGVETVVI